MGTHYLETATKKYESGLHDFYLWIKEGLYLFPNKSLIECQPRAASPRRRTLEIGEVVGFSGAGKSVVCKKIADRNPAKIQLVPEFLGFPHIRLDAVPDSFDGARAEPSTLSMLGNMAGKLASFDQARRLRDPAKVTLIERGVFDCMIDFFLLIMIVEKTEQLITYLEPLAVAYLNALSMVGSVDAVFIFDVNNYETITSRRAHEGKSQGIYSSKTHFEIWRTALMCATSALYAANPGVGLMIVEANKPVQDNVRKISRYLRLTS